MTIQEIAQRLGKSEATIRRLIKQGKLEATMDSGKYDIEESAINAYTESEKYMDNAYATDALRELDYLALELQRRVLDFTQALVLSLSKGVPGKRLLRFADILDAEDIESITQAIEEGCERVDMNEW